MDTFSLNILFLQLLNSWSEEPTVASEISKSYSDFCLFRANYDLESLSSSLLTLKKISKGDSQFFPIIETIECFLSSSDSS